MNRELVRPWLPYVLTLAGSLGFFLMHLSKPVGSSNPLIEPVLNEGGPSATLRIEPLVLKVAKEVGVPRLLSVLRRPDGKFIELEWEGDAPAALSFVDELQRRGVVGSCTQLRMGAGAMSGSVRSQATFSLVNGPRLGNEPPLSFSKATQVFGKPATVSASHPVRVADAGRRSAQDTARLSTERLQREEAERLAVKKQALASQLVLTGIVDNGREAVAFVSIQGQEAKSVILHAGDTIQEARVMSIDANKGELRLDYAGKFEVLVKLKPAQGS